jgi:hypothetical protein
MGNGCDILILNHLRLVEKFFKHLILYSPYESTTFNSDVIF